MPACVAASMSGCFLSMGKERINTLPDQVDITQGFSNLSIRHAGTTVPRILVFDELAMALTPSRALGVYWRQPLLFTLLATPGSLILDTNGRTVRKLSASYGGIILAIGYDARENVEAISWLGKR